jgi:hypothetical protein
VTGDAALPGMPERPVNVAHEIAARYLAGFRSRWSVSPAFPPVYAVVNGCIRDGLAPDQVEAAVLRLVERDVTVTKTIVAREVEKVPYTDAAWRPDSPEMRSAAERGLPF